MKLNDKKDNIALVLIGLIILLLVLHINVFFVYWLYLGHSIKEYINLIWQGLSGTPLP